ncbi:MAG: hypothetical protein ACREF6_13060 [Alphaproteobacteria bacterium]
MFGIGTKSARLIAAATLALGVGAIGLPAAAEAGDDHRRHGGHHKYKHHGHHKYKNHGHRGHHRHYSHRRHGHGHWRSGFSVRIWDPYPPPVIRHYSVARPCHPVVGHGQDQFGRRAKFGGTMCYDRFGNGYVVAGSQHVIHYF